MRKYFAVLLLLALLLFSWMLLAQQSAGRDGYRGAFRSWREADPNLETDAATAGEAVSPRAGQAALRAAAFGAARSAFLRQWADDQSQNVLWLQNTIPLTLPDFAPGADLKRLVAAETATVNTTITTFAGDADRGIQQLRQALEKERTALAALDLAIADREKAHEKVAQTGEALETVRAKALSEYQSSTAAVAQSAALVDKETSTWAAYHTALAEGARGMSAAPAPKPVISNAPIPGPGAAPDNAAPRPPSITTLPLSRYTGVWVYPTVNGQFHGAEPEFVDFAVHESNGKADGTFYARFKLPAGSTGDPQVRFDFTGDFQAGRIQSFSLVSTDGAKGKIELIPASAFNLLEINFQMDKLPGKISAADLLLVKK